METHVASVIGSAVSKEVGWLVERRRRILFLVPSIC